MAYISKFKLPGSNNVYDIKDAKVRTLLGFKDYEPSTTYNKGDYLFYNNGLYIVNESITSSANTQFSDVNTTLINSLGADILARYDEIKSLIAGGIHYRGYTKTVLTDGSTQNPITIDDGKGGYSYTAQSGDLVIYVEKDGSGDPVGQEQEFIYNGEQWNEFGSTGTLKALAFADTASTEYTPQGSISLNIAREEIDANVTRDNYTPAGNIQVTNPTINLSSAASGGFEVVTGIKTGGTDTLNKVSAGTAITVGKKAATSTTVGNANVGAQVTVATGLKTGTGYATTFTTNGIKGASITTETTNPEFSVPTNAISGGTISTNAQTGSQVVTGVSDVEASNSIFYGATVSDETLEFSTTSLSTGKLGFTGTNANTQGYKVATTSADTANVDVDTDTLNKVSESTNTIYGVDGTETITPVTIGDSVTVVKELDTTNLVASATGGSATFSGQTEIDFKITSIKYNNVTDSSSATFTGSSETITVTPDTTQS